VATFCPECWAEVPAEAVTCPACGHALAGSDEGYVEKLIAGLRNPEPTRAGLAVYILGEMLHEPRAVMPLVELLDSTSDAFVLQSAAQALRRYADVRAVPALARRALDRTSALVVRAAAVDALAHIGGDQVRAALEGALTDPSATVRDRARRGLKQAGWDEGGCATARTEPATCDAATERDSTRS